MAEVYNELATEQARVVVAFHRQWGRKAEAWRAVSCRDIADVIDNNAAHDGGGERRIDRSAG
ncbi:hypothetical protein ACIBG0_25575 [Nocardia sp. NPDC050630]|uniref:hypothetical protein n=1 Tax=Nocardia sp. NPDC050630 TaxID=3364321 RepID=UPI00379282C7